MSYTASNHTWALCAYKESAFLEECIKSLLAQTVKSKIIIATSTPNGHIEALAQKYKMPLYINDGVTGIGGDWNFAYGKCDTHLVTIAHQDDIYEPDYLKEMLEFMNKAHDPIIYFSGYAELREGKKVYDALGVGENIIHVIGAQGHRFYADDSWPHINSAIEKL